MSKRRDAFVQTGRPDGGRARRMIVISEARLKRLVDEAVLELGYAQKESVRTLGVAAVDAVLAHCEDLDLPLPPLPEPVAVPRDPARADYRGRWHTSHNVVDTKHDLPGGDYTFYYQCTRCLAYMNDARAKEPCPNAPPKKKDLGDCYNYNSPVSWTRRPDGG